MKFDVANEGRNDISAIRIIRWLFADFFRLWRRVRVNKLRDLGLSQEGEVRTELPKWLFAGVSCPKVRIDSVAVASLVEFVV